ncbi:MAG: porin family protein [Flavobacteriaceae bacterium]|nr:porin family protein [Flavobacteriaceae bacterium]
MKKILLVTFLLLQIEIYAQNNLKWNIGIEFSIDNISIDNGDNNAYLITEGNINGYGVDFDNNNFSLGLITQYFINKKLSISSGLLYSNKDFTGTFNCATCGSTPFPTYSPETIKQRFLVIPASIDYTFLLGSLKPILKVGLKNNVEINNDLKEISKGYFLEAFFGALVNYEFLEYWNIGVGYNYQITLTELYKTDEFNLKTNNFYIQINYKLK